MTLYRIEGSCVPFAGRQKSYQRDTLQSAQTLETWYMPNSGLRHLINGVDLVAFYFISTTSMLVHVMFVNSFIPRGSRGWIDNEKPRKIV